VAKIDSGILSPPRGGSKPISLDNDGNIWDITGKKPFNAYPTPERLEMRRRFSLVARTLSKIYLYLLKPVYASKRKKYSALDIVLGLTIDNYEERQGMPRLLFPAGILGMPFYTVFGQMAFSRMARYYWGSIYEGLFADDDLVYPWFIFPNPVTVWTPPEPVRWDSAPLWIDFIPYKANQRFYAGFCVVRRVGSIYLPLTNVDLRYDTISQYTPDRE
jgi:hypothetical protein